jgi:hypothetical protein
MMRSAEGFSGEDLFYEVFDEYGDDPIPKSIESVRRITQI